MEGEGLKKGCLWGNWKRGKERGRVSGAENY